MSRNLRIALVQLQVECDLLTKNIDVTCRWIEMAKESGADIVLFPEIHLSSFFPQYRARENLAVPLTLASREIMKLREHCRKFSIACLPNIYLREGDQFYDATIAIDTHGEIAGIGKMVHIAQQHMFYEQDYYTPSNDGFQVIELAGARVGIVVCFDRHYGESFRACARQGAELIVIPTANTKTEPLDVFEAELRAAAFQNNLYVAMANRVGKEGEMHFAGESMIVDPHGQVICKAGDTPQLLTKSLNIDWVHQARQNRPYLELLRPEMY
ncbi:carbon-nitrogen hydrolase family protein [Burkholderia territorii]|uniref:carbon-nitrogen hydrolase family protein n=1 Tax=Burkholderia territorii TaxID=1503055 RepID=UPI000AC71881|nr:carbon-nitrogen hydrolase family protein [Burkholderia territorii]